MINLVSLYFQDAKCSAKSCILQYLAGLTISIADKLYARFTGFNNKITFGARASGHLFPPENVSLQLQPRTTLKSNY